MFQKGILNPHVLSLLARVRHTNTLVIADWAFPYWPEIETVDLSLTAGIPTVLQVLEQIRPNYLIGEVFMAEEFLRTNPKRVLTSFEKAFAGLKVTREPHLDFKKRVPKAIGLIRTGDTTKYGNLILESV